MRPALPFYAGQDHFLPRYNERQGDRVYIGRLDRDELARQDLDVRVVEQPTVIVGAALLSGEVRETAPFEVIPPSLKVERDGAVVQDTFIGEQTLIANVRGRGLGSSPRARIAASSASAGTPCGSAASRGCTR